MDGHDIGLCLELLIGSVAMGLAIKQYRDAKKLTKDLQSLASQSKELTDQSKAVIDSTTDLVMHVNEIEKTIYTRYVGPFPDYISRLAELIEGAAESLVVVCDVPAFGYISNHSAWDRYSKAIHSKVPKENIELVYYDKNQRHMHYRWQFASKEDSEIENAWDVQKQDSKFKENVESLLAHEMRLAKLSGKTTTFEAMSFKDFEHVLEDINSRSLNFEFGNTRKTPSNKQLSLYFWIADKKRAVFSIPTSRGGFRGSYSTIGFETADPNLIAAMLELKEYYKSDISAKRTVKHHKATS
jgi:hypothetical protein